MALREPLRMAQHRIHRALRLRGLLPAFKRAFHRGDLSEYDVSQLVDATSCTDDPESLAEVQERTLANLRGQCGGQKRRSARRELGKRCTSEADSARRAARVRARRWHASVITRI